MSTNGRIVSQLKLPPVEAGLAYLRDEIDWHRRAGRLLFGFLLGSVGSSILYLEASFPYFREDLANPGGVKSDIVILLIPPILLALISGAILWNFSRYYSRISSLKDIAQRMLGERMPDGRARTLWRSIFGE